MQPNTVAICHRRRMFQVRCVCLLSAIFLLALLIGLLNQPEHIGNRFSVWYAKHTSFRNSDSTARSVNSARTNIVFIKVHKASSTTVSNMLARYAINHDLNIALPEQTPKAYPGSFHCFGYFQEKRVMPLANGQRYNVLFNHMVYNRTALDNVMPSDTFYFAIMRQPQKMFLSAVYSFGFVKNPAVNNSENKELAGYISSKERTFNYFNTISFDTGLNFSHLTNMTAVQQHIQKLERELDLVMITEHFHESLVLLKRRASLDLRDIVFLKTNARKNLNIHRITDRIVAELKDRQMTDHVVYDHFYTKFWTEVHKEGESFQREVADFTKTASQFKEYCSSARSQWDTFVVARSEWSEEFSLNARDCQLMALEERPFQKLLLQRAKHRQAVAGYREKRKNIPKWSPQPC